ncbi:hypothetical protein ACOSQ3_014633 [Xanthoceras sorbifolium]
MKVFEHDFNIPPWPCSVIVNYSMAWIKANNITTVNECNTAILCAWNPPLEGWIKLNVDGGRSSDLGVITAGGVLRDHSRNWLGGFGARKGIGSVLEAELWGLRKGLKTTRDRGFRRVIVETNSMAVVDVLKKRVAPNHLIFRLIDHCQNLIFDESWNCRLLHIFRECNRLADSLSKMGKDMELGILFFEEPPPLVMKFFLEDVEGTAVPRHKLPLI